jgi:hypothetical protein
MKIIINYKKPIFNDNSKIINFELYNKYIIKNIAKKGGDIFEDLDEILIQKKSKVIKDNIIKLKEHKKGSVVEIANIKINENMTIYDLKCLIYNIIGINIENQHIEQFIQKDQYKNIEYIFENANLMTTLDTCLNNLINYDNNQLYNIPLDSNLINNRHLYIIKEFSKIKKIKDLDNINNLEFDVFNLDDFILNKEQLNKQLYQDTENLNNIFYGFIEKYFGYYTLELFIYYLKSDNKLDLYPSLYVEKNNIINKLNELEKLDNVKLQKNEISSVIKKLNIKIDSYNTEKNLDLQQIFNILELQKFRNIHKIKCKININNKIIYLEKINVLDTKFNNNLIDHNIKNDYISFLITINNKNFGLIDNLITLIIDDYNNIYLTFFPSTEFNLEEYKNLIEIEINKNIDELNKKLNLKITKLNKYNIKIISLDSDIILNNSDNKLNYNNIIKTLQNTEYLNYYKIQELDDIAQKIELNFLYANVNTYINENILNTLTDNYFIFHLDSYLIAKYKNIVYTCKITINLRTEDVRISYHNIGINEYNDMNMNLTKLLMISINKASEKTKNLINANKIKILKENDPKLFIINKNNKNIYSRKCQSNKQPIIVHSKDIKSTKDIIKYWNFTKNKPEYYSCDSKKYPYITFLTGIHPNNYCVPCCRKKSLEDVKIFSSYKSIHNKCLSTFKYTKNEESLEIKSRYIMNYSCKIMLDNNRMMELPVTLKKIINTKYDIDVINQNSENDEDNLQSYYIKGVLQNFVNCNNIGMFNILSLILNKNTSELIHFINSFLISNPNIINNILEGKLLNYIKDIKELIKLINISFNTNILLENNIFFNLWNEFFIELSKYFGFIYIIIEENDIDILNDSKLKLLISNNIKNASEYISSDYKYVLIVKRKIHNIIHYYPILKLNYKEYYQNNKLYKISFSYDDLIISKIKNILKTSIENINQHDNISLDLINKFILFNNGTYKIVKYFLNKKSEIYSILLQINKKDKYIYLNIDNTLLNTISYKNILNSKTYDYNPIKIKLYNIYYKDVLQFITDINKFIFKTNRIDYSDVFYKDYLNQIIVLNKSKSNDQLYFKINDENVNKPYKYLRIQKFIINNNKIIGMICNNLNIYFTDYIEIQESIKIIDSRYNNVLNILNLNNVRKSNIDDIICRDFNLEYNNDKSYIMDILEIKKFSLYKNYYKYYKYNPLIINSIINDTNIIKDNRQLNINKAIYETNLYNLLKLHIVDILKKIKNVNIRNKLKLIISEFNKNDINLILTTKSNKIIYDLINNIKENYNNIKQQIYANIMLLLKNMIDHNKNQSLSKIKELCLDKINNTRFEFDNLYLYNILQFNKREFIKEINKLLINNIIYKNPNTKQNIIDLTLCNSTKKSYYCDNNKLIIEKNIYKDLLEIFYYDITNPFKQQILLNFISINKDIYKFNNFINEKIYIYY